MITKLEHKKTIQSLPVGLKDADIPYPSIEDFENFPTLSEILKCDKRKAQAERVYRMRFNVDGTFKK